MDYSDLDTWDDLHHYLTAVDLHMHPSLKSTLFHRDLSAKHNRKLLGRATWPMETRTDFHKLKTGGLDVGLSTVYIPEQGWLEDIPLLNLLVKYLKPKLYRRVFKPTYMTATINAIDDMEAQVARYNVQVSSEGRKIVIADTPMAFRAGVASGDLVLVHAVEGGHSLHGDLSGKNINDAMLSSDDEIADELLDNLAVLSARGVAYLTLAHFYPNHLVHPVFPYPEHALTWTRRDMRARWDETIGLSRIGEQVVARMFELGMIVDVTHCTPSARARVYQLATHYNVRSQVIATHIGVARMNTDPLNLKDWEVKWIADNGGVVGCIFMNYWLTGEHRSLGIRYITDTMRELCDIGGEDVVAFGSDFDGFTDPPDDMRDMSQLPRLTRQLYSEYRSPMLRQWSNETIAKFMGGNALRVLQEGWRNDAPTKRDEEHNTNTREGEEITMPDRDRRADRRDDKADRRDDKQEFKLDKTRERTELMKAKAQRWKWLAVVIGLLMVGAGVMKGCM